MYSSDHANRDLFCFATDGEAFDGISLLAGPVYKDTASNIDGKDDTQIIENSFTPEKRLYSTYFIHYHRKYYTDDSIGDENLFKKIYN